MFTARKASVEDCGLIREMACVAFPDTYKTILSPEQLDYMMEWMYSPENLRRQMAEGHVYYIAYKDGTPCGYLSVQPEADDLYILQKIYILPRFQGVHAGSFLFRKAIEHIKQLHPAPCRMELHVNRHNKAVKFYERMGMRKLREGDFEIGGGFYMNDYIMGLEIDDFSIIGIAFPLRETPPPYEFTLAWSARNCAKPMSVSGCFSKPLIAASGQVATSAPASTHWTMCCVCRIEAASTCVS